MTAWMIDWLITFMPIYKTKVFTFVTTAEMGIDLISAFSQTHGTLQLIAYSLPLADIINTLRFLSFIYMPVTFRFAVYGVIRPRLPAHSTTFTLFMRRLLFFLISSPSDWWILLYILSLLDVAIPAKLSTAFLCHQHLPAVASSHLFSFLIILASLLAVICQPPSSCIWIWTTWFSISHGF